MDRGWQEALSEKIKKAMLFAFRIEQTGVMHGRHAGKMRHRMKAVAQNKMSYVYACVSTSFPYKTILGQNQTSCVPDSHEQWTNVADGNRKEENTDASDL